MKKKLIILMTALVLLALLCGICLIRDNYRFGQKLYSATCNMSVQSSELADGIGTLQEKFEKGDIDDIAPERHGFDYAILMAHSGFGYENMPILDEVRSEYVDRIEALFNQTVNDENNEKLTSLFTDPEKADEIAVLKNQLQTMTDTFIEFQGRYNEMSVWEQHFVSWKNERKVLSEKVRIPS